MTRHNPFLTGLFLTLNLCGCQPSASRDAINYRDAIIYKEDTPTRYLLVSHGTPRAVWRTGTKVERETGAEDFTVINGHLRFLFQELHGIDRPRIGVETKNAGGYKVIYSPDDARALETVAEHLGMQTGIEERTIPAITIRVSANGHNLKQASANPKVNVEQICGNADGTWPLESVTLDELATFLEKRYCRPVANLTSIAGHWSLLLSSSATRGGPGKTDPVLPLDDTGLELRWETAKLKVLVVKDKTDKSE